MNPLHANAVVIREAVPEDLPALRAFMATLSTATRAARFFVPLQELPSMLTRAIERKDPSHYFLVARTVDNPDPADYPGAAGACVVALAQYARRPPPSRTCDLGLVVADKWQRKGLGTRLMLSLLADAEAQGLHLAVAEVMRQNRPMLQLARQLGFNLQRHPDDGTLVQVVRPVALRAMTADLRAAA